MLLEVQLPIWGARGSEFESRRPDQDYKRVSGSSPEALFSFCLDYSIIAPYIAPYGGIGDYLSFLKTECASATAASIICNAPSFAWPASGSPVCRGRW